MSVKKKPEANLPTHGACPTCGHCKCCERKALEPWPIYVKPWWEWWSTPTLTYPPTYPTWTTTTNPVLTTGGSSDA